ncbi:MAG: XRE family transcriptional regulator [Oscillospiraceae bacterium]|nr:XRE family transcriptional regulator [Oscillospiraceae bacterium]
MSNWELNQGAPSLDKAVELAAIYGISLDDLAANSVQVIAKEKTEKNNVLLKQAEGRMARISIFDMERWVEMGFDFNYSDKVKITEVTDRWIKIEYSRTKENHLLKKETVVKLVDIDVINGIEILEE